MFWRSRSFWLSVGAVAYVAIAALSVSPEDRAALPSPPATVLGRFLPWVAIVALPAMLALVWTATAESSEGEDRIDDAARSAARATFAGAAVLLAAFTGPSSPGFVALGNAGAATASMGALVGLARITSLGGLIRPPESARRLEAAAFASLFWTVAVALPAARSVGVTRAIALDPAALDWATVAASLGALGLTTVTAWRVRETRRLELGVGDRAGAALWVTLAALAIGVASSAVGVASPERVLPFVAVLSSAAIAAATVVRDPTAIARALRVALVTAAVAAPVALGAVYVTEQTPRRAGAVVLAACAVSALAGLVAPRLAKRYATSPSAWLGAIEAAILAAMKPDPDAAVEAAIGALGAGASLLRLVGSSSAERVTVDRAGYRHVEAVEIPPSMASIAEEEPERILRVVAARGVEVRRPELRPIAAWLEQSGVAAVAIVRDELAPVALIALPRRDVPAGPSLEEVRALRKLADRLGSVISVEAALARARGRELEGRADIARVRDEIARLEAARDRNAGQMIALARMLERPARAASYSPAARAAVEQIERLAGAGQAVALLAPPGVDAVAWAALAHLASPRRAGPIAVVDGTSALVHDLAHWRDADVSPLVAAAEGSLVVIDAHALPLDVQSYLGAAAADSVGVIVSIPATVDALAAAGQIDERLADRLGDRAVALPTLAARSEDLRALALEHLARIGVRLGREPLGLAPRALSALLEHDWPANDAELYATLLRAALGADGAVLGPKDLSRVGFGAR